MTTEVGTLSQIGMASRPVVRNRSRLLVGVAALGSSTLIGQVLGAATSLLLRTALTPTQMGIWQGLRLVLSYAGMASLGVVKGAMREYAIADGRGHDAARDRTLAVATYATWLGSLLYAMCILVAAAWIALRGGELRWQWSVGLVITALICIATRQQALRISILRVRQRFTATAQIALIEATLTLVICTVAAWWGGVLGLACATCIVVCATWLLAHHVDQPLPWPRWDSVEIRRLTFIGLPMMLTGLAGMVLRSADRMFILACCADAEERLGLYSTALLVTVPLYGLAGIAATVMAPHLARLIGAGTQGGAVSAAAQSTLLQALAMSLLGAGAIVLSVPLLGYMLPDYAPALSLIHVLVPATLALAVAVPAGQLLLTIDRQTTHFVLTLLAAAVQSIAAILVLRSGYGLSTLAVVTLAVQASYAALILGVAFGHSLGTFPTLRLIGCCVWLLTVPLIAMWYAPNLLSGSPWYQLFSQGGITLLGWCVAASGLWLVRGSVLAELEAR